MSQNLKLQLKTIDTLSGNVEFTHHFHFNTNENMVLELCIGENVYHLSHDGKLIDVKDIKLNIKS